jgi:hypothetical protein
MATRNHEDIAGTGGPHLSKVHSPKTREVGTPYVLENHTHTRSEGGLIEKEIS